MFGCRRPTRLVELESLDEAFPEYSSENPFLNSVDSQPLSPMAPTCPQTIRDPQAEFSVIADTCLTNLRTLASATASSMLEEDTEMLGPIRSCPTTSFQSSKLHAACSEGIANSTSFPQTDAQAACGGAADVDDEPAASRG